MNKKSTHKRDSLLEAADKLVHLQGFHETTLADIAAQAGVPLGNLYYYFKTKEELGSAIITRRANYYNDLIVEWGRQADPKSKIAAFLDYVEGRREHLSRSGCPIGSLSQELHKGDSGFLAKQATAIFTEQLNWLERQFLALGCNDASADYALHLLSAMQGAALLTNTFGDSRLIQREVARLREWVTAL
jgi:TetR/AcrR family transcriptional repressor of nem operon